MAKSRAVSAGTSVTERIGLIQAIQTTLGFCVLGVMIVETILAGLALRATGRDFTILVLGMLATLVLLIICVLVIDGRDRKPETSHANQVAASTLSVRNTPLESVRDTPLESTRDTPSDSDRRILEIKTNVSVAAKRGSPILDAEILNELTRLAIEAQSWSSGELHTPSGRYITVLLTLYANAQSSIFSTTVRDYLNDWSEDLMERMILASLRSPASEVMRIFVFATRKEIDERAIGIIKRFKQEKKITSLVYIDDEDDTYDFPSDIARDFVVMDRGEVIGVTASFGGGALQAHWYFRDDLRKRRFQETSASLERGSRKPEEIFEWWEKNQTAPRLP